MIGGTHHFSINLEFACAHVMIGNDSVFTGNDEVACQSEICAEAHCVTVDSCNDGLLNCAHNFNGARHA